MKNKLIFLLLVIFTLFLFGCNKPEITKSENFAISKELLQGEDGYTYSQGHVFYGGFLLTGVDSITFKKLKYNQSEFNEIYYYRQDKDSIFYEGKRLSNSDPNSFKLLDDGYAIDKNNVYFQNLILSGANVKKFQKLTQGYSKDDKNVYFSEGSSTIIITGADVESFEVTGFIARDKNHFYNYGKIIPANIKPLESELIAIEYFNKYLKYQGRIYVICDFEYVMVQDDIGLCDSINEIKLVSGADVSTFHVVLFTGDGMPFIDSQDKNHKYNLGKIVE